MFLIEHLTTNLTTFLSNTSKKYLYKNYLGYYYFQKRVGQKIVKFSLKTKDLSKALELAKFHNQRYTMTLEQALAEKARLEKELRELESIDNLARELREEQEQEDKNNHRSFEEKLEDASTWKFTTHIHIEASPDDDPVEVEKERQRLIALASKNKNCEVVIAKELDKTNLQDLINDYIAIESKQSNWTDKTVKNNQALFKVLTDYLKPDTLVINITPDSFKDFLTFMLDRENPKGGRYKPQTINRILNDLKKFFDRAVDLRKLPNNPMKWIKPLKELEPEGGDAIGAETMHKIFHRYEFKQDYKDMYKVLAYTGFRSGELFHLQCQDLIAYEDDEGNNLYFLALVNRQVNDKSGTKTKNSLKNESAERIMIVNNHIVDILKKHSENKAPTDYIFFNDKKVNNRNRLGDYLRDAERGGLRKYISNEKYTLHSFRKNFSEKIQKIPADKITEIDRNLAFGHTIRSEFEVRAKHYLKGKITLEALKTIAEIKYPEIEDKDWKSPRVRHQLLLNSIIF